MHVNKKNIKLSLKRIRDKRTECVGRRRSRASVGTFDGKSSCPYCGCQVPVNGRDSFRKVRIDNLVNSVLAACATRSDPWTLTVRTKVEDFEHDLHAPECVYHHTYVWFRFPDKTEYLSKIQHWATCKTQERRQTEEWRPGAGFHRCVCLPWSNWRGTVNVSDLPRKMKDYWDKEGSIAYDNYNLKCKLKRHYKDSISSAEKEGLPGTVTMN